MTRLTLPAKIPSRISLRLNHVLTAISPGPPCLVAALRVRCPHQGDGRAPCANGTPRPFLMLVPSMHRSRDMHTSRSCAVASCSPGVPSGLSARVCFALRARIGHRVERGPEQRGPAACSAHVAHAAPSSRSIHFAMNRSRADVKSVKKLLE